MKILMLLISLILFANLAFGHTCSPKKVKCPIDKTTVEFCVTMSMTTFGSYLDFQKQGAIGNHYEELINSCPKCRYSGYASDFDTTFTIDRKNEIKVFLSKFTNLKIDNAMECLIAGELKEFFNLKNASISNCYLIGSYLVRKEPEKKDFRIELQKRTKNYLIKAIENNEYDKPSIVANINFLIAEMYRRIGNFEEAVIYFDKAINDPNKIDWVEELAMKQKEMAIKKDDNNEI